MTKPMLAHSWDKHKSKVNYPCVIQPKLDGIRCLAQLVDGKITFTSRTGKDIITMDHLKPVFAHVLTPGMVLDGELYAHGVPFQTLIGWIKKVQDGTEKVAFHCYDIIKEHVPFSERRQAMKNLPQVSGLEIVEDRMCFYEYDVDALHKSFLRKGYEGSIIRNIQGRYKQGRSFDLLKRKDFLDEEFEIVAGRGGKGKFTDCAVLTCITKGRMEFNVVPKGTYAQRKQILIDIDSLIGKQLTVQFFEKSLAGIPRFPVGICIRDYEI